VVRRRALLFAATVLGVIAADQATKALVRAEMAVGESKPLIDGVFWLTHVHNTGAAFGMFRGQQWMLVLIAAVVLVAIAFVAWHLRPDSVLARTALALIAGGAAGNLIDRAVLGGVTDFLDLGWWPVFNVADMALDVGVAILVWWVLFGQPKPAAVSDSESADE
jgi:signal peptidase II